mgnify:CR=1 FL=1|tara:strand:+ start:285 stop:554 length:270 start_codon:yes stop_codon:yes gene_type:complete
MKSTEKKLRAIIREVLKSNVSEYRIQKSLKEKKDKDNDTVKSEEEAHEELLTEPDKPEKKEVEKEYSSGGVAGVSVPIGRAPTFPKKKK